MRRRRNRCPSAAVSFLRRFANRRHWRQEMNCAGGSSVLTILTALKQSSWLRPKYLLFAAIGLMLTYVIPHDESFLVHPKDPL